MPPPYKRLEHNPAPSECSDIVTIKIPSGKEYAVHTHLLAHYSRYCQQKLNQRRKKATRCIELSLFATEDTISLFIEWIYVKHIMREEGQHGFGERTNPPPDFHENLIKAFSFGDFIEAIQFQNYIMPECAVFLAAELSIGLSMEGDYFYIPFELLPQDLLVDMHKFTFERLHESVQNLPHETLANGIKVQLGVNIEDYFEEEYKGDYDEYGRNARARLGDREGRR
ncbi:uncharacterized protein F4822DRAFT_433111 [Hypoxylon trugodes]|uniref:uncharacterized protein n=1 Tax=Hypoxylon trugodes TaxID=326681 RepID=UPI00219B0289|nr:uncharacterized protein F4822DRAFT_433111 [Hypoxylon trugodes]KAI1384569.1 hypothetical protein F4822DRAFT_433111 [Hypoxylon trugodes]